MDGSPGGLGDGSNKTNVETAAGRQTAKGLHTGRRQPIFLVGMLQPSLTWCVLGLTYLLLKMQQRNDAVWLSGLLALYALQISAVWYQPELLSKP